MKYRFHIIILLCVILLVMSGEEKLHADLYRYIDDTGTVVYTDDLSAVPEPQRESALAFEDGKDQANMDSEGKIAKETNRSLQKEKNNEIYSRKELQKRKSKLDKELERLQAEKARLEKEKLTSMSEKQKNEYQEKAKQYNQNIKKYNKKKRQLNKKIEQFNQSLAD